MALPSPKLLNFAKSIAKQRNELLPEDAELDAAACHAYIDAFKNSILLYRKRPAGRFHFFGARRCEFLRRWGSTGPKFHCGFLRKTQPDKDFALMRSVPRHAFIVGEHP